MLAALAWARHSIAASVNDDVGIHAQFSLRSMVKLLGEVELIVSRVVLAQQLAWICTAARVLVLAIEAIAIPVWLPWIWLPWTHLAQGLVAGYICGEATNLVPRQVKLFQCRHILHHVVVPTDPSAMRCIDVNSGVCLGCQLVERILGTFLVSVPSL